MHLGFIGTGEIEHLRRFEKWWSTRSAYLPIQKKDGTKLLSPVNIQLRPVNFYELIFPREQIDIVLNTMSRFSPNEAVGQVASINPLVLAFLRKRLKYDKIPEWDKTKAKYPFPELDVRTYGLGIREDVDCDKLSDWDKGDIYEAL